MNINKIYKELLQKTVLQDVKAEEVLLGQILIYPDVLQKIVEIIDAECFFKQEHQYILS